MGADHPAQQNQIVIHTDLSLEVMKPDQNKHGADYASFLYFLALTLKDF